MVSQDVIVERLSQIAKAMEQMREDLADKPSTAKVESMIAHLVSQRDHDQHTFKIEQQAKDLERLASEFQQDIVDLKAALLEKIEQASPKRLAGNVTMVLALLTSALSLIVALGLWKPKP